MTRAGDILRQTGSRVFNGMHLRVEPDAAGWGTATVALASSELWRLTTIWHRRRRCVYVSTLAHCNGGHGVATAPPGGMLRTIVAASRMRGTTTSLPPRKQGSMHPRHWCVAPAVCSVQSSWPPLTQAHRPCRFDVLYANVQVVASGIMANPTAEQRKQLKRFNGTIASAILDKTPFLSASACHAPCVATCIIHVAYMVVVT